MKAISRIAILAAVALVVAASVQPASAACSLARLIEGCAGGCQYISTPGQNTTGAGGSLQGNFWGFGGGNPALLSGDDNGSIGPNGNADPANEDWIKAYGALTYIAGTWGTAGVDGCIDNATTPSPKRTVVLITDQDTAGHGYWGVVCKEQDTTTLNYPVGLLGAPTLMAIPYPRVLSSSRVSGVSVTVNVQNAGASLGSGNVLGDPSCAGVVTGYRLYTQVRPNSAGQPTDRARSAGWTAAQAATGINTDAASLLVPCGSDTSVYVATSLQLNSGFETPHVSEHRRVPCDPSIADRPGNFKIIKKPDTPGRGRQ